MPICWTLPFLQQEEIRYMLLLGSIFAVFRLTLRSMVQQLDSILEKATDGLFIPISENRIVKQFMVIPITIVCGEGIIMAFVVNSVIVQILFGCTILICATVLNFWLEVTYKDFLVKKDFILNILRQEYAVPEQCVGRDGCGYILRGFFVGDVDGPERDVMLLRGLLHLRHPVIGKGTLIGVVEDEAFSISFRVLSTVLEFRQCCIGVEREAHESDSTV